MALDSVSDNVVGDFEVADEFYDMLDHTPMLDLPEAEAGEINGPISGAAAQEICFGTVDRDVMLEAKAAKLERKLEVRRPCSRLLSRLRLMKPRRWQQQLLLRLALQHRS